jgi:hypothetical protein
MPDKSFEKNVQENFDGFGLAPSPKVWMRVEEELHRKDKRRRGIIWMFFGLITLLGGAYLITDQSAFEDSGAGLVANVSPSLKENVGTVGKEREFSKPQAPAATVPPSQNIPDLKVENPASRNNSGTNLPPQLHKRKTNNKQRDTFAKNTTEQTSNTGLTAANNKRSIESPSLNADIPTILEDKKEVPEIQKPVSSGEKIINDEEKLIVDADSSSAVTKEKVLKDISNEIDSLTTVNEKKIVRVQHKKTIQLGVKASVAMTAIPEKFLGTSNKSALADNLSSGNSNSFPGLSPLNYTYDQRQSYGFEVGAWIKLPVGKKAALSTGIDYTYLSTTTSTGTISSIGASVFNGYQSVALDRYYLPGALTKYRNQYHLLQIPLEYSIAWRKSSRLPVVFSAGINPGLLLSSNALLKDSSGILYSDKSNYNKLQLGLSAGFSVRLFNRSKFPLDLGPVAQYQLTNSFRRNTGYNGHLFYLGIQGSIPLFNISKQQR